jgi:hypothetical protein
MMIRFKSWTDEDLFEKLEKVILIVRTKNICKYACNYLSGVDVMITILCHFCQFSAKNWRFSQKPML